MCNTERRYAVVSNPTCAPYLGFQVKKTLITSFKSATRFLQFWTFSEWLHHNLVGGVWSIYILRQLDCDVCMLICSLIYEKLRDQKKRLSGLNITVERLRRHLAVCQLEHCVYQSQGAGRNFNNSNGKSDMQVGLVVIKLKLHATPELRRGLVGQLSQ